MKTIAALLLCTQLSGCLFFVVPIPHLNGQPMKTQAAKPIPVTP